jgi:hypothetical protein
MPITKPYKRINRPLKTFDTDHLTDPAILPNYRSLISGYHSLQKSLENIFEFIEPADSNLKTFSHKTYELLLRASTEFESHAKGILIANGYPKKDYLNIKDYKKIDKATKLSEYEILIDYWREGAKEFQPYVSWKHTHTLDWYQDYNNCKHNRESNFEKANLENCINSVAAVLCILYAQLGILAFEKYTDNSYLKHYSSGHIGHPSILFYIKPFDEWSIEEKYEFNFSMIKGDQFQNFQF